MNRPKTEHGATATRLKKTVPTLNKAVTKPSSSVTLSKSTIRLRQSHRWRAVRPNDQAQKLNMGATVTDLNKTATKQPSSVTQARNTIRLRQVGAAAAGQSTRSEKHSLQLKGLHWAGGASASVVLT